MRRLLPLTILLALGLSAPAPAQSTAMRACVKKKGGAMRMLLTPAQRCRKRERLVTWNATGVQGLPGAAGPAGAPGSDGATGPQGVPGPIEGTPAGGALTGTFPNPMIAPGAVGAAQIAASLIDAPAATPGLRRLGSGATQAAAGNDHRLSNPRVPAGPAGGDLTGDYPAPIIRAGAVRADEVGNGSLRMADIYVATSYLQVNPGVIAAGTCATVSSVADNPTVNVGDVVGVHTSDDWDSRLLGATRRVTVDGTADYEVCNIGNVDLNPPAGLVRLVQERP